MTEEFIDMSDINLDDTFEPTIKADGEECELRILSFMPREDKNDDKFFMVVLEVADDPYCRDILDFIYRPNAEKMAPKKLNDAKLKIAAFAQAFDINFSAQVDIKNNILGRTGWAILGTGKNREQENVNTIKSYTAGA